MSTVRPTVHAISSRKRSFSKTLFKAEEFEDAGFSFFVFNILKTKLCESDDVTIITWQQTTTFIPQRKKKVISPYQFWNILQLPQLTTPITEKKTRKTTLLFQKINYPHSSKDRQKGWVNKSPMWLLILCQILLLLWKEAKKNNLLGEYCSPSDLT